jgi:HEAT repeat protein
VPPTPPPAIDPAEAKRRAADVDRNVALLKDPSDTVAFSAAHALGDLGDLRAVPPLVEMLKTHRYYYARLAAAASLGQLRAADAMPALIDALEDKDTLVQTAVAEAIEGITGEHVQNPMGRSKKELKALKDHWTAWWKSNEAEVRRRLNQPPS